MGLDKLRRVLGFVKDVTSVGKAFVQNYGIRVALLRATNHYRSHIDEKSTERILLHVSVHPESVPSLADCISRRLDRTRDPVVALKTLFLIHRILRGNRQVHVARAFGNLLTKCACWFMRNHEDPSSAFLPNYAAYLLERAGWIVNESGNRLEPIRPGEDEEEPTIPLFHDLSKCQQLIEKVLNFASFNTSNIDNLVQAALCSVLEEGFQVYGLYSHETKELRRKLSHLSRPERDEARAMLRKAAQQSGDLRGFYDKCREDCVGDYPSVEVIGITPPEQSTTHSSSLLMFSRFHRKFSSRISYSM